MVNKSGGNEILNKFEPRMQEVDAMIMKLEASLG